MQSTENYWSLIPTLSHKMWQCRNDKMWKCRKEWSVVSRTLHDIIPCFISSLPCSVTIFTSDPYIHESFLLLVVIYSALHSPTSVPGALLNLYFLRTLTRGILASIRANLIPIQLQGPHTNGMFAREDGFWLSPQDGSCMAGNWSLVPYTDTKYNQLYSQMKFCNFISRPEHIFLQEPLESTGFMAHFSFVSPTN